jgi:nicotinamidase/pyrazinamidase
MYVRIEIASAFSENDRTTRTGLAGYLRDRRVSRCVFVALAYRFCVSWSALDARRESFEAAVMEDYTRAIAVPISGGTTVHAA